MQLTSNIYDHLSNFIYILAFKKKNNNCLLRKENSPQFAGNQRYINTFHVSTNIWEIKNIDSNMFIIYYWDPKTLKYKWTTWPVNESSWVRNTWGEKSFIICPIILSTFKVLEELLSSQVAIHRMRFYLYCGV